MCIKTGENLAMWCGCIVHRITIITVLTHLKWKISWTSTTTCIFDCNSLATWWQSRSLTLFFRATQSQQQHELCVCCALSTIKYFYLWLFRFGWNSISGTSKSMSAALSLSLSVCVCVYFFHFNIYFFIHVQYSIAVSNLMPLSGFCSVCFFSIQQIACEKQTTASNTSMSSIIVRLFISMWNRKKLLRDQMIKILSIYQVRFNN